MRQPQVEQAELGSSSPFAAEAELVCIGTVIGAHGLKGAVKAKPAVADPAWYQNLPAAVLAQARRLQRCALRSCIYQHHAKPAHWQLQFADIETRSAAEALKGAQLLVARQDLKPLTETFSAATLLGYAAYDAQGTLLGTISAVLPTGANDVLEIQLHEAPHHTALLPATAQALLETNAAEQRVCIEAQLLVH